MSDKFSRILRIIIAIVIVGLIALSCILPAFAKDLSYNISQIGVTMSIPDSFDVITRDTDKNDEIFDKLGMDYDDKVQSFQEGNLYLEGWDYQNNLVLTVTMITTRESKGVGNFSNLTEDELKQVRKGSIAESPYKTTCKMMEINGVIYMRLTTKTESQGQRMERQQYNTVANGNNYVITLQASNGKKLKTVHKNLFREIMNSVKIGKPSFFRLYGKTIAITSISVVLGIALIVLLVILVKRFTDPERKHKNLVHQLAHEHKITETTQVPRKKLYRYMLENAPEQTDFMEEYDPIEEIGAKKKKPVKEAVKNTVRFTEVAVPQDTVRVKAKPVEEITEPPVEELGEELYAEVVAEPVVEEAEVIKENMHFKGTNYFTDVPDKREMYVYSDVSTAVEDYKLAKKIEQRRKRREAQAAGYQESKVLKILKAVGKGLLTFLQALGAGIVYFVVHLRYFCINLYRLIKRKNVEKKRRKIIEERRRKEEERLKMKREAEMRRRQRNSQRGENDLVQVRSRNEGRTYPRSGYDRNPRRY